MTDFQIIIYEAYKDDGQCVEQAMCFLGSPTHLAGIAAKFLYDIGVIKYDVFITNVLGIIHINPGSVCDICREHGLLRYIH